MTSGGPAKLSLASKAPVIFSQVLEYLPVGVPEMSCSTSSARRMQWRTERGNSLENNSRSTTA